MVRMDMDCSNGIKSVEMINNDILTEILVRLPPKSIFKFTCVSKRWNNLIMDPCFFKLYHQRTRKLGSSSSSSCSLLGFVQCNTRNHSSAFPRHWKRRFLSVSSEDLGGGGGSFFPPKRGCFVTSSNDGLFLWGVIPTEYEFLWRHIPTEYHVGNPITKRWFTLPPSPRPLYPYRSISVGLATDVDVEGSTGTNINFRLVVATGTDKHYESRGTKTMRIQTYSSRTGRWRSSNLTSEKRITIIPFWSPTVIGRVFHWLTLQAYLVVYDSSSLDEEDDDYYKLSGSVAMSVNREKKKNVLELIELPYQGGGNSIIWRSDNGQTLWYGVGVNHTGRRYNAYRDAVRIYRLEMGGGKHDKDDWTLVNKVVDEDTLKKEVMQISSKDIEMEMNKCRAAFPVKEVNEGRWVEHFIYPYRETVFLIAFVPWDTRLVIVRLWERVFVYDWENQRMDEVELLHGNPACFTDFMCKWYPYFHSLFLSSPYASFLLGKSNNSTSKNKHYLKHHQQLPSI